MKKVLNIIIVLLCSKLSFGQFPNGAQEDNSSILRQFNGGVKALNALIPPTIDTGVSNPGSTYYGSLTTSPLHKGKLFMSTQDGWVTIGSGGGSGLTFPSIPHNFLTGYDNVFGTLNTDSVIEATNLFFTTARARASISALSPFVYNSTTGQGSIDTTIIATKTDIATRWSILGNAGTSSSNFIGTTDSVNLFFRVKNLKYGFLSATRTGSIALGDSALIVATGGSNTAYGNFSLKSNTTGSSNVGLGYQTLKSNTTSTFNTAVGTSALFSNVTGNNNTAVGGFALLSTASSDFNTAVGATALEFVTGDRNTAVGFAAGSGITSGVSNTSIGENSFIASNGNYNTMLGKSAGRNSSGDSSLYLGFSAGSSSTGSNKLYIANNPTTNLIAGDFLKGQVQINAASVPVLDASAALDVISTTRGFLPPRMTTTAKNAIVSPSQGLMVMDTTTHFPSVWNGSKWASRIIVANSLGSMQFPVGVGDTLRFVGDTTMSITFNSATSEIDFHSLGSGGGGGSNNFLSAVSFSGGTLTFARSGLSDLTQSIDGRYVKISDSAAMLTPYLRSVTAAATYATISNLALKVNISDSSTATTGWTTKYQNSLNKLNTDSSNAITGYTSRYQNGLKLNKTDSTDMTVGYTTRYQNSLKQNLVNLTTTGSGAATFNQTTGALNIPIGGGSGGNTNTNSNVSGFRLAIIGTNTIKTIANKWGMILDSTTVANPTGSISLTVDSNLVATKFRLQQSINDSLNVNTLYISHALSATDSLYQVFSTDSVKFKVPKAVFPIVLTTIDTAFTYSIPNFQILAGKTLSVANTLNLQGTDGTIITFPTTSATMARTDAVAQTFLGDVTLASTTSTNNTIGRMRSGASNAVSNIVWQNEDGVSSQTLAPSVPNGIAGINYRVNFAGAASTLTASYGYSNINIAKVQVTSGGTGAQPYAVNLMVQTPAYSNGGARTNILANELIQGKPLFTDADTAVTLMVKGTTMLTDSLFGSIAILKSGGLATYNTTDQVTNYTRGRAFWTGGEYTITTEKGGTGLAGNIALTSDAGINMTTASGFGVQLTSSQIILNGNATSTASGALTSIQATSTYTGAGTVTGLTISPTYNQTASSAINTDLLINRTQTSLGSGAQKFMDAQVAGTTKFSIANTGNVSTVGSYTFGTTTTPAPASGSAVLWFDGTNIKMTKNASGVTTTATIF